MAPRAVDVTDALIAANLALTQTLDLDAVLGTLLDHLARLVPYDSANVMLLKGNIHLVVRATRGYERFTDPLRVEAHVHEVAAFRLLAGLVAERRSVLVPDTAANPHWRRVAGGEHVRGWLAVPLVSGGQVLGLYSLDKAEAGFYKPVHLRLAEALAAPAAIAVQNALLYAQVRDHAERLRERASESARAAAALRRSEQEYRVLFELNPQPMFVVSQGDRHFLAVNEAALRTYGYSREEFLGMAVGDLHPLEEIPALLAFGADVAESGSSDRMVAAGLWKHRRKDGSVMDVEMSWGFIPFGGGQATIGMATDVTDRKRTEEALKASEERLHRSQKMEAVGKLAGGVAHDFNNLLTVITGSAEPLQDSFGEEVPERRLVEAILSAADRAASLTRQLLAFSRKQVVEPQLVDLNNLVTDMEKMLRRLIDAGIDMVILPGQDLGRVRADPGQIEQVVMNLVLNARDAMSNLGQLRIETAAEWVGEEAALHEGGVVPGRYAVLTVRDTGAGMDPDTLARIFEPFFTTKDTGKGTGLGLSTVYGIVRQNDGFIRVESELGQGSAFRVYLPEVDGTPEATAPTAGPSAAAAGSETILLVEDEGAIRELVRARLAQTGYQVLEARHPGEALEIAERYRGPIRLLLTDVVMPHMNGVDLARRLRAHRPNLAVLYMSAYADEVIADHGLPPGALLEKPFTASVLLRRVREALDASATLSR